MPLSFLVPAFLAGLAALAVPVVIHLTRRQTRQTQEFPSLMFLARIPHESTSRRRIHRWPLLLLRCAALALLVFAFARPFVETSAAGPLAIGGSDREVVILLDRSYSMGYGDLWERAVQAAREVLDGLGSGDRATLVLFDNGAEVVEESTPDVAVLRTALSRSEPGPRGTRYAPALQYAQRVLSSSPLGRREVTLISDFQRNAWDSEAGIMSSVRLPVGTTVTPVALAGGGEVNVAVASVSFQRSYAAGYERVAVTARLTSHQAAPGSSVPVALEVDGRVVETRTATLEPSGTGAVQFTQITLPETGAARGTVRIPDDALPADNEFHFVLSREPRIGVLVLNAGGAAADGRLFLERALTIGEAPGFRVTSKRVDELQAADLARHAVVILNQSPFPSGELGQRLQRHVEEGGGLVIVMGDQRSSGWEAVLASRVGNTVDHARSGGTSLGFLDLGHPIFVPFASPRSGDFTAARVFRYRELPEAASHRVLARFGDGGAALVETPLGSGRALAWTAGFDPRSSDLALQPVFLPFLHQVVKHAAGYTPARAWLEVGEPLGAAAVQQRGGEPYRLLVGPEGNRTPIEQATAIALDRPGFYELRRGGSAAGATPLAVNVDRSESELEAFDPRELVSALTTDGEVAPLASATTSLTMNEREERQSAWRYLLIVAFAMLALETLLSNRARKGSAAAAGRAGPGRSQPARVR
jgi:hypothetical protein